MGEKFKVEMIGWECHIQVKNLSSFEVDNATDVINDVAALEETYFFGENDFESCALDNSGNSPLTINVYDAENNLILEMQGDEVHLLLSCLRPRCHEESWHRGLQSRKGLHQLHCGPRVGILHARQRAL